MWSLLLATAAAPNVATHICPTLATFKKFIKTRVPGVLGRRHAHALHDDGLRLASNSCDNTIITGPDGMEVIMIQEMYLYGFLL